MFKFEDKQTDYDLKKIITLQKNISESCLKLKDLVKKKKWATVPPQEKKRMKSM